MFYQTARAFIKGVLYSCQKVTIGGKICFGSTSTESRFYSSFEYCGGLLKEIRRSKEKDIL